ncbi:MBL fold metallo-hydrolase [Demequina aestuarii]|uniref:MBL fold metallo-hydrolase n=1 Tax=Demequina aestuarii TaxID=327095 RepID=UPI00128BBE4A|nr:MBL fold metallo-hydrolase [Demequina aestuarii]
MKMAVAGNQWAVGQGGFYSGRVTVDGRSVLDWVYDCGSSTAKSHPAREIRDYARSHELTSNASKQIDAVFISHFDADHFNALSDLAGTVHRVARVILPLVSLEQRLVHLLSSQTPESPQDLEDYVRFVVDPGQALADIFGQTTQVISVTPRTDFQTFAPTPIDTVEPIDTIPQEDYEQPLEFGISVEEGPGLALLLALRVDGRWEPLWELVAWTPLAKWPSREALLASVVSEYGLTGTDEALRLLSDSTWVLGVVRDAAARQRLKRAYEAAGSLAPGLSSRTNRTSMLLYSGPVLKSPWLSTWRAHRRSPRPASLLERCQIDPWPRKVAWLGTGDISLNHPSAVADTRRVLGPKRLGRVGVLNLPHHGADPDYPEELLRTGDLRPNVVVAAAGSNNHYDHPGRLSLFEPPRTGAHLVVVSEERASRWRSDVSLRRSP